MRDHIIGFRSGQRVKRTGQHPVEGVIEKVVVPAQGRRFALIRDDNGGSHRAEFNELEET